MADRWETGCLNYEPETDPHTQTNADRIRSMTDEELEKLLISVCNHKNCPPHYEEKCYSDCDSGECWVKWLKQEVGDN
jgi:hypothetical protein